MGKVMTGTFIGVFVGALTYELIRRTEIGQKAARKFSEGLQAVKKAFKEGYQGTAQENA